MGSRYEGVWVSSKNENYDAFLKAMNIGMAKRVMARTLSTTLNIKYLENDKFQVESKTGPQTREVTFEVGQVVEDKSPDGANMKGKWHWDGEDMVCDLENTDNGRKMTLRRCIEDGKLVQRLKTGDVECTRWFDKKAKE